MLRVGAVVMRELLWVLAGLVALLLLLVPLPL